MYMAFYVICGEKKGPKEWAKGDGEGMNNTINSAVQVRNQLSSTHNNLFPIKKKPLIKLRFK